MEAFILSRFNGIKKLALLLSVCILGLITIYTLTTSHDNSITVHGNVTHGDGQHDGFTIKTDLATVTPNPDGFYIVKASPASSIIISYDGIQAVKYDGPLNNAWSYDAGVNVIAGGDY